MSEKPARVQGDGFYREGSMVVVGEPSPLSENFVPSHRTPKRRPYFEKTSSEVKFQLDDVFLAAYATTTPNWGPLGYVTYKRTYARDLSTASARYQTLAVKHNVTGTEEWWLTVARVVEGTYRIQEQHCKRHRLYWDDGKAQQSAQEMYRLIFNFKFLPPGRGLWMMGTEYIEKHGGTALNNCFAYNTEIITRQGIKKIGDCAGTIQTVLSTGGKWVDAPIRSFGAQELYKMTLTRQGVEKDIYTTANHRWFAEDRRTAYRNGGHAEFTTVELRPGIHRLQQVYGQGVKEISPSPFGVAHGFTYGDGTTTYQAASTRVNLIGDKDVALKKYFPLCNSRDTAHGVELSNLPNYFRELPSIGENKSYLYGWLSGYFAADGSCTKAGSVQIASSKRSDIEFVRDVCVVLGINTYSIQEETRISNLTKRDHTMYKLSLSRASLTEEFFVIDEHRKNFINNGAEDVQERYWTVKSVESVGRSEEVFCATVDGYGKFALEGNILTGNCAFVTTKNLKDDFAEPFCFLMDMSMLGVGVGSDTKGAGTVEIKAPVNLGETHFVEDTREGWVEIVRRVLNAFVGDDYIPVIDYSLVRPYGAAIQGFGGTASGPGPLKECVEYIIDLLLSRVGQTITSSDIVDIFNVIGRCVVAGNVRRTAEIMFGDPDDQEFLNLKNPALNQEAMDHHRWCSNNSIFGTVGQSYDTAAELVAANGEPGVLWMGNAQAYSRMIDPIDYKDAEALGANPCNEQTLHNMELCTLVETFPSLHASYTEYERTLKFAYLYAKTVTLLSTHNSKTNAVMLKNRRIGTSMTGIVQAMNRHGKRAILAWADVGYKYLKNLDGIYSNWLAIPRSIKITSVKPSGTVSLLPGVTPGIHFPHSKYYYRTIRFKTDSTVMAKLRANGYACYELAPEKEPNTTVVYFPIQEQYFGRSKFDVTMWEQLELAAQMQAYWADNQVSVTVTFQSNEAKDIKHALELYETRLKGVSMLPAETHGYEHAPYQAITEEEYLKAVAKITPVTSFNDSSNEVLDKFCDGESCTI